MPMPGGTTREAVERLHAPLQELVAGAVALELHLHVELEGVGDFGEVHLHGVVHDQVHRHQRLDDAGVAAHAGHGGAHGGQVHQQRDAGEVLQDDPRDDEGDLLRALRVGLPVRQGADVVLGDAPVVVVPQHRLQHDADADGQLGDGADALGLQLRQRIELPRLAAAIRERLQRVEKIVSFCHCLRVSFFPFNAQFFYANSIAEWDGPRQEKKPPRPDNGEPEGPIRIAEGYCSWPVGGSSVGAGLGGEVVAPVPAPPLVTRSMSVMMWKSVLMGRAVLGGVMVSFNWMSLVWEATWPAALSNVSVPVPVSRPFMFIFGIGCGSWRRLWAA